MEIAAGLLSILIIYIDLITFAYAGILNKTVY